MERINNWETVGGVLEDWGAVLESCKTGEQSWSLGRRLGKLRRNVTGREAQVRLEISRDLECHSESIGVLDWRLCILEIWIENFEF